MKTWITLGSIASIVLVVFLLCIGTSNREVRLRNEATAQQKANEAVYDTMWKIIKQQAEVAEVHKDSFYKGFKEFIESRKGGVLLNMIVESNPNFDTKLFVKLMRSIEGQRTVFLNNQKRLIDIKNEHDNILDTWPGSWILSGREHLTITIVTSTRTDDAFKSGKDDETKLFK